MECKLCKQNLYPEEKHFCFECLMRTTEEYRKLLKMMEEASKNLSIELNSLSQTFKKMGESIDGCNSDSGQDKEH